jgi:hypothetical protein
MWWRAAANSIDTSPKGRSTAERSEVGGWGETRKIAVLKNSPPGLASLSHPPPRGGIIEFVARIVHALIEICACQNEHGGQPPIANSSLRSAHPVTRTSMKEKMT